MTHLGKSPLLAVRYAGSRSLGRLVSEHRYEIVSERPLSTQFFDAMIQDGFFGRGTNFRCEAPVVTLETARVATWDDHILIEDGTSSKHLTHEKRIYTYRCYTEYDSGD